MTTPMNSDERAKLLADLESGSKALEQALRDVTEGMATKIPGPGKWSILECVEHLVVSEDYLLGQIAASKESESPMINPEREALIVTRGLDRSRKIQAPDVGKPAGRFSTLAEGIENFRAIRRRTVQFAETCQEDLRCKITSHPIIGKVNCYEMLLMIAVHPHRHAKQIEEIKAALQ